ncbi:DUF4287 domain-containing protein [Cellulomonas carbonis]|uniref:DUF4287 domain-containing protein n=1 Tax=Cellulomonas carbonis T26 TaxID=947969 RepID=A0A0A0BRR7_9CELL|nr:DUF4287 domain-containing protein [Cellulomonas carbonis]KGM09804.1 hypothetical protein N868_18615 [Cellulomonas carbonis T26]GGC01876.1 hypothetical protein GCM10010972_13480 [Cellulomonas carbonis]
MVKDPIRSHEAAVTDRSVVDRTGRPREEWFALLDAAGATGWTHPQIARWLGDEHGVDGWWCQSLTVGYEQARGMRAPGQRPDGTWEAGASVTVAVPLARAWELCTEPAGRARWLDVEPTVRGATEGKTVRWTFPDGTRVLVSLTALPDGPAGARTRVSATHRGVEGADAVAERKAWWRVRLGRLREVAAED